MLEFFVVLLFLAVIFAIIYAPVGWAYIRYCYFNRKFEEELSKLDEEYWAKHRIVITDRLGEGSIEEYEKAEITFKQALKNKDVALNATIELLNDF